MPRRVSLLEGNDDEHDAEQLPPTSRRSSTAGNSKRSSIPKTPATPIPIQSPPYTTTKDSPDWEREYHILRRAYRRQEERVQRLEEENKALQREVKLLKLLKGIDPTTTCTSTTPCSPGTKFVAELVEVMELNVGHHTILADIVDRQQERARRKSIA